jgi:aminocarboxymuconate-semialdehyde decarboxylase
MIDVHTHVVPLELPFSAPDRSEWPWVQRTGDEAVVYAGGKPFRTVDRSAWDPERRLEEMEASGVRRQVLSPMPELFCYGTEPRAAETYCREMNEWLGSQVGEHFDGFGILPMQDPQLAAAALDEVRSLGLRGVEIGSNVNGEVLHSGRYDELFAEAARLSLTVFVHPFHPHGFDTMTGGPAASGVTFPNEIGFALGGLIAEGVVAAHPDLRLCASHGGGSLGLLLPRLDRMWLMDSAFRERLPDMPSSYARRVYVDLLVFSPHALAYILDVVGDDRVVVGSDYPFMPDRPGAVLDELATLGQGQRRRIEEDNAECLLQSDPIRTSP